jgi:hypothetical protein
MIYDDEPRRRRHYPIWSENRAASGSQSSQGQSARKPRSRVISRPKRDLIVGLAQRYPAWTAQDIHHWIRYQIGRNDVSLKVIKRVLTKMS